MLFFVANSGTTRRKVAAEEVPVEVVVEIESSIEQERDWADPDLPAFSTLCFLLSYPAL